MMGAQLYKGSHEYMLGLVRQNVALAFSLYNASDIEDKVAELKGREQDIDESSTNRLSNMRPCL